MREAAAIYHRRLGGEHPALGNALNGLARVLYGERKFAEAEIQARGERRHPGQDDTRSLVAIRYAQPDWPYASRTAEGRGRRTVAAVRYEGMKQRERTLPANRPLRLRDALQGLVDRTTRPRRAREQRSGRTSRCYRRGRGRNGDRCVVALTPYGLGAFVREGQRRPRRVRRRSDCGCSSMYSSRNGSARCCRCTSRPRRRTIGTSWPLRWKAVDPFRLDRPVSLMLRTL